MTGYGEARHQDAAISAAVEVRAVNNRYLKVVGRFPDWMTPHETEVERAVRQSINRGTITVSVRVDRVPQVDDYTLNNIAIKSYWAQLQQSARELHAPPPSDLGHLLALPGVVTENHAPRRDSGADVALALTLLGKALLQFHEFRVEEGRSMVADLQIQLKTISTELDQVAAVAPQTAGEHRNKLLERVRQVLAESGVTVEERDVIREVAIYADRGDINEEITRLRSHLQQFGSFLGEQASSGRKLDFLSQEMVREINTIGSKASHVGIARSVVEMKAAVERIREVLQNVE